MSNKCPKGKSCSCGGEGRWEPMCEGIEEYVSQDEGTFGPRLLTEDEYKYYFDDDNYPHKQNYEYFRTEEYSLIPLLSKRNLYRYYKMRIINKQQYFYLRRYFFWGLSYSEIAKKYNKNPSTVYKSITRALKRLRKHFEKKIGKMWH